MTNRMSVPLQLLFLAATLLSVTACKKKGGGSATPTPTPFIEPARVPPQGWFAPEPGSDIVEMFTQPEFWTETRSKLSAFQLPESSLKPGVCGAVCNGNSVERLVQADAFRKLKNWNIPLVVGTASVKPSIHCDAVLYGQENARHVHEVASYGGKISAMVMDWPLASGRLDCGQSMETTAAHVVNWVNTVQAAYSQEYPGERMKIGLYEGMPLFTVEELKDWLQMLIDRGYKPDFFILDADHVAILGGGGQEFLRDRLIDLTNFCRSRNISFGIALWGRDMTSPENYVNQVKKWTQFANGAIGTPDIFETMSWEYWVQKQNVGNVFPANLPETSPTSHTNLFLWALKLFQGGGLSHSPPDRLE